MLEGKSCQRCAGSGRASRAASNRPAVCWYCRGLGRRISAIGRRLFREICELLGDPAGPKAARESRIDPRHLDALVVERVRPGMCVREQRATSDHPFRMVTAVEPLVPAGVRIRYADGSSDSVSQVYRPYERRLTDAEVDQVQQLMRERVGQGSVTTSDLRPLPLG